MELLRPARMEDFEALNRIAAQVAALHASWGNGMAVDYPYPMDYFQECLKEDKLYVACLDGEVVGYMNFYFWTAGGPAAAIRRWSASTISAWRSPISVRASAPA